MTLAVELVGAHIAPVIASTMGGVPSTLAAAGANQGTAARIGTSIVTVTGATGANGVILPAGMPGDAVTIYSSAATNALLVYPPSGAAINAIATNAAYSQTAQTTHQFRCFSATSWLAT
jgi:hypothetical protein